MNRYGFGYLPSDYPGHLHPFWEIHFFSRGEGLWCSETAEVPIRHHHLFVTPPETRHRIQVTEPLVFHYIQISDPGTELPLFRRLAEESRELGGILLNEEFRFGLEEIRIKGNREHDPHARAAAWYLLLALLHGLKIGGPRGAASGASDPVDRCILYLNQHIRERVTLDHLADSVNLNKHHLSRIFKLRTGLTPMDYFIRMKLDSAARLLRDSEWSHRQIAEHLALGDEYYFSRLFRKKMGYTPRDYRMARK